MANGLEKMRIIAYEDPRYETEAENGTFTVQVNPEGYKTKYNIEYALNQAPGSSGQQLQFNKIRPERMEFDFLFDKTGSLPNTFSSNDRTTVEKEREEGVMPELEAFKRLMTGYEGEIHRPYYLELIWGRLIFRGVLLEMTIDFKLFLPDGTPIRTVASCKFESSTETERRIREQNDRSPDITRIRQVQAGDQLPLLADELYNDPAYYIKIAQANSLTSFRNLAVGQQIVFPPVSKD